MFSINLENDSIKVNDIKQFQFPDIVMLYNSSDKYKYATGHDIPVSMIEIKNKYLEVRNSEHEFMCTIFVKNFFTGIIKGRINDEISELWISSLLIKTEFQRKGIGSETLKLFENHFKEKYKTRYVYLSVVEDNIAGINFWSKNSFDKMRIIKKSIFDKKVKHNVIVMRKAL
jgi:ribosomal protein S18 acetylase RimI-like enzyme